MLKHLIISVFFIISTALFSQHAVLDSYVQQGIESNLGLKQKKFSLQKSMYALREARALFLPNVSVEARYSRADGGRLIEIPVGDLVNPIYRTLNQLLSSVGQPANFPENIPNESVPFFRVEEHETKIRIVQPIFQPSIYYNYKIKKNMHEIKASELALFKKQLKADIKTSYFNFLKSQQIVFLLEKTRNLVKENLRVSEKLFQNGKATEDVIFRSQAEVANLDQQLTEARNNRELAASYFNFLLNRPLDSEIRIDEGIKFPDEHLNLCASQALALNNREEFRQLEHAIKITKGNSAIAKSTFLPGLSGVFDYGYQGEKYSFTSDDDYWMASLVMQWNLFNGFKNHAQKRQADMQRNELETQFAELQQKIKLQVQEAFNNIIVAKKAIESARKRMTSAEKSFQIIRKKYSQGMVPQIEYLDARTTLTNAEVTEIIATYDYYIKHVEFDRITGNY